MKAPQHATGADDAFWRKPVDALFTELKTQSTGLTQQEANKRLRISGPNRFEVTHGEALLVKFGKRALNPLVALLSAAAAVSGISGDFGSFFIIIAVLALSITLDIVQEHRAEQEAEALRHSVAVNADVMRDLKQDSRPVSTLVPRDIVLLRTGDLVPADGIVLESDNLQLDESILTGEPFLARKTNAPCDATEVGDASNVLFAVQHVASAVGLAQDQVLTGAEIAQLTDAGLAAKVEEIDLFARVDPDQKKRIIDALRRRGHVTGFLGDGINDAPAIHAAHVGLSVDGATDVARAAADMILLASDLNVLAEGVREGRRTFANILKYVRMGTSSNFGNMLSMALASIALPFLPLLPLQILLNNLLYDLSEIGIPFDAVDAEDTARPHTWDMTAILRFTIVMGIVSSLFDAATFLILLKGFGTDAAQFQTGSWSRSRRRFW